MLLTQLIEAALHNRVAGSALQQLSRANVVVFPALFPSMLSAGTQQGRSASAALYPATSGTRQLQLWCMTSQVSAHTAKHLALS
jgi:hypothetical protein